MDIPICPDWWPKLIWDLHFIRRPWPNPPPVNLPIIMEDVFSQLSMHTLTYTLHDQKSAQVTRDQIEESLSKTIRNLSKLHDQAQKQ